MAFCEWGFVQTQERLGFTPGFKGKIVGKLRLQGLGTRGTRGSIPENGLNLPALSPLHSKWKVNVLILSIFFNFLYLGHSRHYKETIKNTKLRILIDMGLNSSSTFPTEISSLSFLIY